MSDVIYCVPIISLKLCCAVLLSYLIIPILCYTILLYVLCLTVVKDNELEDVKCLVPDRCYATIYQEVMSFCKQYGQFDVSTMGNVANVGLM